MKFTSLILAGLLTITLMGCHQDNHKHGMQMSHLTILIEHAIGMMAQGAALKQYDAKHGNMMLSESAGLLRRAMSGPEMTAMHKGGQGVSPAMKKVHALGAASFDLLELMMDSKNSQNVVTLLPALSMAAKAANLNTLANMNADMKDVLKEHSQHMQDILKQLDLNSTQHTTPYQQAIIQVIRLLENNPMHP